MTASYNIVSFILCAECVFFSLYGLSFCKITVSYIIVHNRKTDMRFEDKGKLEAPLLIDGVCYFRYAIYNVART